MERVLFILNRDGVNLDTVPSNLQTLPHLKFKLIFQTPSTREASANDPPDFIAKKCVNSELLVSSGKQKHKPTKEPARASQSREARMR